MAGYRDGKKGRHLTPDSSSGGPTGQEPDPATHTTEQATAAPGTHRGHSQRDQLRDNVHTFKQEPPLTRGYACPRWDSNRTPVLAIPPLPRKPAESGPVRHQYNPIRSPRCAHCAHPLLPISATSTGLLNGRPGREQFRSNMTGRSLEPNPPEISTTIPGRASCWNRRGPGAARTEAAGAGRPHPGSHSGRFPDSA
ncbi:hypothetical protein Arth_1851 [Arthrobacter sp. FB24]|nr:hypothetical protein Arth_1851 [Arthrobacter sp. FB24]